MAVYFYSASKRCHISSGDLCVCMFFPFHQINHISMVDSILHFLDGIYTTFRCHALNISLSVCRCFTRKTCRHQRRARERETETRKSSHIYIYDTEQAIELNAFQQPRVE